MSGKYKFVKSNVKENIVATAVFLYKENTNCDGNCKKVNTCPIINDQCK